MREHLEQFLVHRKYTVNANQWQVVAVIEQPDHFNCLNQNLMSFITLVTNSYQLITKSSVCNLKYLNSDFSLFLTQFTIISFQDYAHYHSSSRLCNSLITSLSFLWLCSAPEAEVLFIKYKYNHVTPFHKTHQSLCIAFRINSKLLTWWDYKTFL